MSLGLITKGWITGGDTSSESRYVLTISGEIKNSRKLTAEAVSKLYLEGEIHGT